MADEYLINWLNNKVKLSKPITNICSDFRNGYRFAEILHIFKQIPNFSKYKDSKNISDILNNYTYLTKAFSDLKIKFSDSRKHLILQKKDGIAHQLLLEIRQVIDSKLICKETLKTKYEREFIKIYNKNEFKNNNEKYYKDYKNNNPINGKIKLSPIEKFNKTADTYTKNIIREINKDREYIEKEKLKKYKGIKTIEKHRSESNKLKDIEALNKWDIVMKKRDKFEYDKNEDFWKNVKFYKNAVFEDFKQTQKNELKLIEDFKENLSKLGLDIQDENLKKKMLKKTENISTEIIMKKIREQVKNHEKMRKNKLKRDRKLLNHQIQNINNQNQHNKSIDSIKDSIKEQKNIISSDYNKVINNYKELRKIHSKRVSQTSHTSIYDEDNLIPYISREDHFDADYFFAQLHKETVKSLQLRKESKEKKRKKISNGINNIMNMILNIVEDSYKFQINNKKVLIDIPEWDSWMNDFIDNKYINSDDKAKLLKDYDNKNNNNSNEIYDLKQLRQINKIDNLNIC